MFLAWKTQHRNDGNDVNSPQINTQFKHSFCQILVFFVDIGQLTLKFTWESIGTIIAKPALKK